MDRIKALCFEEFDKICEENKYDEKTVNVLRNWLLSILMFYKPSMDILNHSNLEEYIKYNFEKLKKAKDIKVLEIEEIINNPNSLLYKCIIKMPFDIDLKNRLSKSEECYNLDKNGKYYLSANGVCHNDKKIELLNEKGLDQVLHHELQHINQNYVYPSEFPFANDMLKMLNEGEAEYHSHLIDLIPDFQPIEKKATYDIYYFVYILLMLILPKEMCTFWSQIKSAKPNSHTFSNIFKYISDSERNRKSFSEIFALATSIVASCDSENTKEIFAMSVNKSLNRCTKKVETYNKWILRELEETKKSNLESLQYHIEKVNEIVNILDDSNLLQEKYLEIINDEKEFIASEPKETQYELLNELQLFTLEKFKSRLIENVENGKSSIKKYQNKKVQTTHEILGEEEYKKFKFYQFGMELNKSMLLLLEQDLAFTVLFDQFLEKVSKYLIENKDSRLDEKLAFIDEIRNNCLISSKKI